MTHKSATFITITMLTLISTLYVFKTVIGPNVDDRIAWENKILSGQMEPPYQYRILEPLTGHILEKLLRPFNRDIRWRHSIAYLIISFAAFFTAFLFFYLYLAHYYSHSIAVLGIVLLQTVIPLSVTGFYMEGDFITVAFYALGLYLLVNNKDIYLPVIILLASLNREQSIFLAILYTIYIISNLGISKKRILILSSCIVVWFLGFLGTRFYFGFKPSIYTFSLHIAHNTNYYALTNFIGPLWLAEVIPSIVLCIAAFQKSSLFFRLSFLSLFLYTLLFFLNGNIWELAKYLPAFLVMIPMGLQVLSGEYIPAVSGSQAKVD